jgi:chromosomal replication initiation ATPase DnaA
MRSKKFPTDTKNLNLISSAVCHSFGIDLQSFLSPLRKRDLVFARHAFCYLAKAKTDHSLLDIGFFLGNRDHSTVINSIRQCSDLLEFHNEFRRKYQKSEFIFDASSEIIKNIPA